MNTKLGTINIIKVDFEEFIGANRHTMTSNATDAITPWNVNKQNHERTEGRVVQLHLFL